MALNTLDTKGKVDWTSPTVKYFADNLVKHLAKDTVGGETNQPRSIISAAKDTLGTLSRIFDAFYYPVITYEELKKINEKSSDGLKAFMEDNLKQILPLLLSKNGSELSQEVIKAIGQTEYDTIITKWGAKAVANQFSKAILISYGQRVLDSMSNENTEKKQAFYTCELVTIGRLAKGATVDGLAATALNEGRSIQNLRRMLTEFKDLVAEPNENNFDALELRKMKDKIDEGFMRLDDDATKTSGPVSGDESAIRALECYDDTVTLFIANAKNILSFCIPSAEAVNWFKKVIRFIFRNEKLLETEDEKRYGRQVEVLSQLSDMSNQLQQKVSNSSSSSNVPPEETKNGLSP